MAVFAACGGDDAVAIVGEDCETVSYRNCECPDGGMGIQRACDGRDYEPCRCGGPPGDGGPDPDAGAPSCRANGVTVPCWQALLSCFPTEEPDPTSHLSSVCDQLCSLPTAPSTRLSCNPGCLIWIDLGFCAASCEAVLAERPVDAGPVELCP